MITRNQTTLKQHACGGFMGFMLASYGSAALFWKQQHWKMQEDEESPVPSRKACWEANIHTTNTLIIHHGLLHYWDPWSNHNPCALPFCMLERRGTAAGSTPHVPRQPVASWSKHCTMDSVAGQPRNNLYETSSLNNKWEEHLEVIGCGEAPVSPPGELVCTKQQKLNNWCSMQSFPQSALIWNMLRLRLVCCYCC